MTGWNWDYVENTLTVERIMLLYAEWERNPPLTIMVAAFLGIKPKEQGKHEDFVNQIMASGLAK
ncbi:MAG: hypothetical protein WCJ33_04100 [Pseudomonadota bacterium]